MPPRIRHAFHDRIVRLDIRALVGSRVLDGRERRHQKYKQIAASIRSIGIIEPLVVFPIAEGKFRVLDGHKRLDILIAGGTATAECLLATDDEAYTYNKRVNYLSTVSEHWMILRALKHNDAATVASALDVNVDTIRKKRDLLNGVCREAVDLLKDRRVSPKAFSILRKMKPVRQVEAVQLMRSSNLYSERFAWALLAGTPDDLLVEPNPGAAKVTQEQKRRMETETEAVIRNMRSVEAEYGNEILSLTIGCRYVSALLERPGVKEYLRVHHSAILTELESLIRLWTEMIKGEPNGQVAHPTA